MGGKRRRLTGEDDLAVGQLQQHEVRQPALAWSHPRNREAHEGGEVSPQALKRLRVTAGTPEMRVWGTEMIESITGLDSPDVRMRRSGGGRPLRPESMCAYSISSLIESGSNSPSV